MEGHKTPQRQRIDIFGEAITSPLIWPEAEGLIGIISIGAGETHVSVRDSEARQHFLWTAVFGWSQLCNIELRGQRGSFRLDKASQLERALSGHVRIYGFEADATEFIHQARSLFRVALSQILDDTIHDGSELDQIGIACPEWLQPALQDCLDLRPHINKEFQDV